MDYTVIIAAAGTANRMHLGFNKVLYKTNNETVLERTVSSFLSDKKCKKVVIAVNPLDLDAIKNLFSDKKVTIEIGGETRSHSVHSALKVVDTEIVMVHDAARPFITKSLINRVRNKLEEGFYSVVPTIIPIDAVLINGHRNSETIVKLVQTPQGFNTHQLRKAYDQAFKEKKLANFKDDASIVEKYFRYVPAEVEGEIDNIKLTTPKDLKTVG